MFAFLSNKNRMKNIMVTCLFMACVFLFVGNLVKADDNDDEIAQLQASISSKQDTLDELEAEKASIEAGRTNIQNIVNNLKANRNEINSDVQALDAELSGLQNNIAVYEEQIATKLEEIEVSRQELEAAEAEVQAQYDAMKERIRFMYETGDTLYLDMLLTANSFGEMLNKADYIEMLSSYDRAQLEEYKLTAEYTMLCKEQLEQEEAVLEEEKAALEEEQANVNTLLEQKEELLAQYNSDISEQQGVLEEYDAEIAAQNEVINAIEAQIAAEQAALEEASRRHYNGGAFVWPAPSYTRISDPYGWRMHPTLHVQKLHNGVDLAAPGGSSILAAADGDVVAAGYSSTMGNYIMIDHGDNLITIYMHASALYVSKGQSVTAGQTIAAVGSTGRSTGNHLHFGVRRNGEYVNPMNYL